MVWVSLKFSYSSEITHLFYLTKTKTIVIRNIVQTSWLLKLLKRHLSYDEAVVTFIHAR